MGSSSAVPERLLVPMEGSERAGDRSVESTIVFGKPSKCIVEYADEHAIDQIVIGNNARGDRFRGLLGDTATAVVRRSPVPVTVVR